MSQTMTSVQCTRSRTPFRLSSSITLDKYLQNRFYRTKFPVYRNSKETYFGRKICSFPKKQRYDERSCDIPNKTGRFREAFLSHNSRIVWISSSGSSRPEKTLHRSSSSAAHGNDSSWSLLLGTVS